MLGCWIKESGVELCIRNSIVRLGVGELSVERSEMGSYGNLARRALETDMPVMVKVVS